jgi:hypothetical protein
MQVRLDGFRANEAGVRYGFGTLDQEFLGNDILRLKALYTIIGYTLEVENRSEYSLRFLWNESLLVDKDGWTHSFSHPDVWMTLTRELSHYVDIAPAAKRRILLIPAEWTYGSNSTVGLTRAIHSKPEDLPEDGMSERLILVFRFRESRLVYDIQLTILPTPNEATNVDIQDSVSVNSFESG